MKKILITLLCLAGTIHAADASWSLWPFKKSPKPAAAPVVEATPAKKAPKPEKASAPAKTPAPAKAPEIVSNDDVALLIAKIDKQDQLLPVIVEFYDADAPGTVANFKKLAHKKFYNGLVFHRVFAHILVQGGDPLSKRNDRSHVGTGGPGYTLPPEIHRKHTLGAVAMSRLPDRINPGRVSSGSQFYICLKPQSNLDGQYTVFGHVVSGMENLDRISQMAVDSNDNPLDRAEILSVKILPRMEAEKLAERAEKSKPSKFLQFFKSIDI